VEAGVNNLFGANPPVGLPVERHFYFRHQCGVRR
jgi:hypothetical protein